MEDHTLSQLLPQVTSLCLTMELPEPMERARVETQIVQMGVPQCYLNTFQGKEIQSHFLHFYYC